MNATKLFKVKLDNMNMRRQKPKKVVKQVPPRTPYYPSTRVTTSNPLDALKMQRAEQKAIYMNEIVKKIQRDKLEFDKEKSMGNRSVSDVFFLNKAQEDENERLAKTIKENDMRTNAMIRQLTSDMRSVATFSRANSVAQGSDAGSVYAGSTGYYPNASSAKGNTLSNRMAGDLALSKKPSLTGVPETELSFLKEPEKTNFESFDTNLSAIDELPSPKLDLSKDKDLEEFLEKKEQIKEQIKLSAKANSDELKEDELEDAVNQLMVGDTETYRILEEKIQSQDDDMLHQDILDMEGNNIRTTLESYGISPKMLYKFTEDKALKSKPVQITYSDAVSKISHQKPGKRGIMDYVNGILIPIQEKSAWTKNIDLQKHYIMIVKDDREKRILSQEIDEIDDEIDEEYMKKIGVVLTEEQKEEFNKSFGSLSDKQKKMSDLLEGSKEFHKTSFDDVRDTMNKDYEKLQKQFDDLRHKREAEKFKEVFGIDFEDVADASYL